MTILSASSLVIPGYEYLSEEKRASFENSIPGQKFSQLVQDILAFSKELDASIWVWQKWTGVAEQKKRAFESRLSIQRKELLEAISETEEYKTLIANLVHTLLEQEIDMFQLLTTDQQQSLSRAEFSKKLCALPELDAQIEKERKAQGDLGMWSRLNGNYESCSAAIAKLEAQRKEVVQLWNTEFLLDPNMASLRKTIGERKRIPLQEHATQLGQFFPLLNYRRSINEDSIVEQIRAQYLIREESIVEPDVIDEELLSELLYFCMQQMNHIEMDFLNLDSFNKKQAHLMAREILQAFKNKNAWDLDDWFKRYEHKLHRQVIKQLQLVHGKKWVRQNEIEEFLDSLSYLWSNPVANTAQEYIRKMADAHGFIQATRFSTQNENSYLAFIDIYNYHRYREQIAEGQTILSSLFSPLMPLYNEYKDIALYEKNPYWKFIRTMMPILIVSAFILLVAVLLSPLALPQLAFTIVFIPSLLMGLALATKYVSVKDQIYNGLRERYYGGAFEIPEFQVNTRMLGSFGTMEKAAKVRTFYIEGLKNCDDLEKGYILKHEQGLLSQEDIDLREENKKNRYQLWLEWYDIHSNNDIDFQRAPLIIANRLQQKGDQEFQQLQDLLQEEEASIGLGVAAVTADLKETIVTHNKTPVLEIGRERETTTIQANYRYGLFSPPRRCLELKAHLEELADLKAQVSVAAA